jgi:tyrosyl-tRNA synthetase
MSAPDQSLFRYVEAVYPSKEKLEERLKGKQKLRVYFGVDPTNPKIHIGHSVPLRLLRCFQEMGHKIIFLFGDFTAQIGDPSGRDAQRKPLTSEQIKENSATYEIQVRKVLDFDKNAPEIEHNSSWWKKTTQKEFFEILSHFTLSQLSERDLFKNRIEKGQPIAISEFLYPILQGYDSVALNTDVEIGARDQTFNMLAGREMVKIYKKREKFVLTTPLLEGTDGRKMSKSYSNTIDVGSEPSDMYGKLMSLKDELIVKYLTLATDVPTSKIDEINERLKSGKINPMSVKKELAFQIVKMYHGPSEADNAQQEFERVFQKRESPKPETKIFKSNMRQLTAVEVLLAMEMVKSKSEARRLINQGGVLIDDKKVRAIDEKFDIETGSTAQISKRRAVSVKVVE